MAQGRRFNPWFVAAFACFGLSAAYVATAVFLQKKQAIRLPPEWFLVGVFLFVALGNTGAIKEGRFFGRFYECSRDKTPIMFWFQAVLGYLFSAAIAGLFVYQLQR